MSLPNLLPCDGEKLKAHKAIVCPQSRYFDAAFSGEFQEGYQNCIDLPGHDVRIIRDVLSFLYLGDYGKNAFHEVADSNPVTDDHNGDGMTSESSIHEIYRHLRVYVTADIFGIDDLKISKKRLARWVEQKWREDSFPLLAAEILRSSPPHDKDLSDVLANVIAENIASFIAKDSMLDVLKSSGGA
ncbi:hypothetical protein BJX96DRAFT_179530 [Aspergillus floccosus]